MEVRSSRIIKDSAWVRLMIIIIKYTMKNLSLILKLIYIFETSQHNETKQRKTL